MSELSEEELREKYFRWGSRVARYNSNLIDKRWGSIGAVAPSVFLIVSFNIGMSPGARGGLATAAAAIIFALVWILYIQKKRSTACIYLYESFLPEVGAAKKLVKEEKVEARKVSEREEKVEKILKGFILCCSISILIFLVVSIFIFEISSFGV